MKGLVGVRGHTTHEIELFDKRQTTKMWNPLLFALAFKQLHIVKYFIEDLHVNAKLCLRDPFYSGENDQVSPTYEVRSKCFAVLVSMYNEDLEFLDYLVNNLHYLWSAYELEMMLQEL